ncbi:acyl-CoA dehydrogenase family protein [Nocardia inohanensis]|uniref:acyl-CoA dehydrogenase family protein n=1 Tax=Nocardia inohanensis TaxID=209246 RepID=UPI00082AE956|nr:acyl-CoA dehydrogenase family protein [Nocardia inohanensis]
MTESVLDRILAGQDELRKGGPEADRLGRLTDSTVEIMKAAGSIKMLQPRTHGGLEVGVREFAEAVMATAALNPPAGWVHGVVGVHPWQLAMADPRVQEEVWGEDDSTWVASPYMPNGRAIPVAGGYRMSGRWGFSSGTDHCRWAFLGAMKCDADGNVPGPPTMLHVIVPRSEYSIIEDSWDVVGLKGTGSKDLVIEDTFIPEYRVMEYSRLIDGSQVREAGLSQTLYRMPWSCMFPLGITAATIGICEGLLAEAMNYQRERINAQGTAVRDDPYTMYAMADAAAQIRSAREGLITNAERIRDLVDAGKEVSFERRAAGRRNQVNAAWQAVRAIDDIYPRCGGAALRMDRPLQRYWRDAHAGLHHAIHNPGTVYHAASLSGLGFQPEGLLRAMI